MSNDPYGTQDDAAGDSASRASQPEPGAAPGDAAPWWSDDAPVAPAEAQREAPRDEPLPVPPGYEPYVPYEDPYTDVPASLELAYTSADLGLSPRAYERTFPYESRRRRESGARLRRVGREIAETVILAVLIFFAVRAVVQNFRVEGASMQPSLQERAVPAGQQGHLLPVRHGPHPPLPALRAGR